MLRQSVTKDDSGDTDSSSILECRACEHRRYSSPTHFKKICMYFPVIIGAAFVLESASKKNRSSLCEPLYRIARLWFTFRLSELCSLALLSEGEGSSDSVKPTELTESASQPAGEEEKSSRISLVAFPLALLAADSLPFGFRYRSRRAV